MKKGLFLASIFITVITLSSCGPSWNRKSVTKNSAQLTNFSSIDIDAYVDATITVDPAGGYAVKFEGEEDVLNDITAQVKEGILVIEQQEGMLLNIGDDREVKVSITVPSLNAISFSGAGEIRTIGNITTNTFALDVSGAGEVTIAEINADKLSVESSGVAGVDINKGVVREANFDFSGAGSMDAYGLQTTDAIAEVSGVGSIDMTVTGKLEAHLSGVGGINYKGNPTTVDEHVSGVGAIKRIMN